MNLTKFFGKNPDDKITELQMYNSDNPELRNFLEDFKKLDDDWRKKADAVRLFLQNWSSKSGI